jgi:predicted porin
VKVSRLRSYVSAIVASIVAAGAAIVPATAWAHEGDLAGRVSDLEATALTKRGTGAPSLQIYGQINRALLYWDDGFDRKASVVDNSTSSSRFGFIGQAPVAPGLVTGYRLELGLYAQASEALWNRNDIAAAHWPSPTHDLVVRQAYWFLRQPTLGTLSLGHQSPASDDITIINLGSQMNDGAVHYNNAFNIRLDHPALGHIFSDLKWGHVAHNVDALRGNFVRYDTPLLAGFMLSASAGEDQVWDVALRYQAEWQNFRFAGGIGFMDDREELYADLKGSASLLHTATGLYLSGAAGVRDDDRSGIIGRPPAHFQYLQAGIRQSWLPFGPTTLYGDAGIYRNFGVGEFLRVDPNTQQLVVWGTLAETEVMRWGFGIEQSFEETGVLVYLQMHRYEPEIVGFPCANGPTPFPDQCGGNPGNLERLPVQPWSAIVVGTRVRF